MSTQINFFIVIVIFMVFLSYSSSVPHRPFYVLPAPTYPSRTENPNTRPICREMRKEMVCGRGNEDTNSTWIPKCSESCDNGNCTEPKVCNSSKNCGEDSRNETLICLIAYNQPNQRSDSEARGKDGKAATAAKPPTTLNGRQKPPSECYAQCKNITLFNITRLEEKTTYCWTHIQSPCIASEINYWKLLIEYKYAIGGTAIGIISLVMMVCICCIVRRKRKPRSTRENIPLQSKYPEYMEDNVIYS